MRYVALITLILTLMPLARAADVAAPHGAAATTADASADPHPRVPDHPTWAKNLVATIIAMFVLAFFFGPIFRRIMPQAVEPPHAHEEHGHGAHDEAHGHGAHDTHGHGHAGHH